MPSSSLPSSPRVLRRLAALASLGFAVAALAQQPAFPGALGFGAAATGGRGGAVYHVTNLNDSGPGSFRDAVGVSNRIVVFDVGGYITLAGSVSVNSNILIAGQTAPGDGIAIRGAEVSFGTSTNIVCRYVRFRPGSASPTEDNAINLYRTTNAIFDHCSFEFAKWNNIDAVGSSAAPSSNITVQNSIIANPIGQQFGAHTECVGGNFSWFFNLWANGHNRQPLAKDNTIFVNNTLYNHSAGYTTHTSTPFKHDILNNYFICGPASSGGGNTWYQIDDNQSMYFSGNLRDANLDGALNGSSTVPLPGYQGGGTVLSAPWSAVTTALLASANPPLSAAHAVVYNTCAAGALPHDQVDALVVSQVKTLGLGATGSGPGSVGPGGGLYTSETQTGLANGGFGTLAGGLALIDSDRDGMSDDWESAKGLNAALATDGSTVAASGYTNVEDYLNWLASPHAFTAKNTALLPTALDIDLRRHAAGFPVGVTFTVTSVTGGAFTQSGAGGYLVHYVPTQDTSGLGGFTFSTTSGGYTFTSTFGILISPNPLPKNLSWTGAVNTTWNTTAANWLDQNTLAASAFSSGDRVTLDDTGAAGSPILLTGTTSPGYVTVSGATKNYTLAGTGSLSGGMPLVVDGAGTLTLANTTANTYSGGTFIQGSTLILAGAATLGGGPVTLQENGALTSNYPAATTLSLANNILTVPAGNIGTVHLSPKMVLGAATGSGTLNLKIGGTAPTPDGSSVSYLKNYLTGSWSGFSGTVNITGVVPGAQLDLNINGGGFNNFGAATVNLDAVTLQSRHNSGGNTIAFGALNGTATARLGGSEYGGNATYAIGGLGTSGAFAGTIANGIATTSLTKSGGGTLTLTGALSYTGTTTVGGGTLAALGPFASLVSVTGGTLSPGTPAAPVGTLVANKGLSLSGGSTAFDLSASPAGLNDKITVTTGSLTLSSAHTIKITFAEGTLGTGVYDLIDGASTMSASNTTPVLSASLPAGARQTFTLSRGSNGAANGFLKLTVSGSNPAALAWTGVNGGVWDLSTTHAWASAAATNPNLFYNFDSVLFDDSSPVGVITITGSVQPYAVNVTNTVTAYTFAGAGSIAGAARLVKSGPGSLTFAGTGVNTYTGGTTLDAGTLALATTAAAPFGTGRLTLNGGTLQLPAYSVFLPNSVVVSGPCAIASAYTGNSTIVSSSANTFSGSASAVLDLSDVAGMLTVNGDMGGFSGAIIFGSGSGTLRLNGNTSAASDVNRGSASARFDLGSASATLANRNGDNTVHLGALESTGADTTLQGRQTGVGASSTTYVVGALNLDTTFAGRIATGGDTLGVNITKVGSGVWTLSGASGFTGAVSVQEGSLALTGSLANLGDFTVRNGATLRLSGGALTTPSLQIEAGGILAGSGTLVGSLTNQGTMLVNTGGTLTVQGDIENDGYLSVTNGSALVATGAFVNNGILDLLSSPQTTLPAGFVNNGSVIYSGNVVIQSYAKNGDDFTLTLLSFDGHDYQLQRTASLAPAAWENVGAPRPGRSVIDADGGLTGGVLTFTDVGGAGGPAQFYRIVVSP